MSAVLHSFAPLAGDGAKVLILGSMPGEESQRQQQYYAYRFNAFWPIMEELFGIPREQPYAERLEQLKNHHVALWDTLAGCERAGSLDSSIRAPEPNDIAGLLSRYPSIHSVFCNGTAAFRFLKKYHSGVFQRKDLEIVQLPSTSPAAARLRFAEKLQAWEIVREKVLL